MHGQRRFKSHNTRRGAQGGSSQPRYPTYGATNKGTTVFFVGAQCVAGFGIALGLSWEGLSLIRLIG